MTNNKRSHIFYDFIVLILMLIILSFCIFALLEKHNSIYKVKGNVVKVSKLKINNELNILVPNLVLACPTRLNLPFTVYKKRYINRKSDFRSTMTSYKLLARTVFKTDNSSVNR